jgi:transcriptional regulator with XRE-family HTH domain
MHTRNTNDSAEAASRIRELRLSLGLTQAQVAAELGWHSRSRVACYENRLLPFSAAMEARIVQAIRRAAGRVQ